MGKVYAEITPELSTWLAAQKMFFVGSAPLSTKGHVNVSPKGLDTLRVLGPRRVAYLDLTGSGAETIAHLRENGRIVLMFCAFSGPPKIVRLHGAGNVVTPASGEWPELHARFPGQLGARAIVDVEVSRISDSCGYGVPIFAGVEERVALPRWAETRGPQGLQAYRREKNVRSIDGLPSLAASDEEAS
ncbi:MAG TPA: pyridoxamine 5'-phosphate oxidase family protein [Burkholderiales bacterium]|nr:pyridoxamine 5'-phosphate oxidase family protein [Burkholderiales bacterium]